MSFIIIALVFLLILALVYAYFEYKKKILQNQHIQIVSLLKNSINLHFGQIDFRNKSLSKYHFLRYNLDEALRVQPEIKLISEKFLNAEQMEKVAIF